MVILPWLPRLAFFAGKDWILVAPFSSENNKGSCLLYRDVNVGLFDVAHHLVIQLLLQSGGGLHDAVSIRRSRLPDIARLQDWPLSRRQR